MASLLFGPQSITEAQLIAFSAVAVVFLFLLIVNVAICRMYYRASTESERQDSKARKKKISDVWVYHVHRPHSTCTTSTPSAVPNHESADQQILRKLQASHENLRATMEAGKKEEQEGTLGEEESQALEELEVTADLFLHDTSNVSSNSSRRSSLSCQDSHSIGLSSVINNLHVATGSGDELSDTAVLDNSIAASVLRDLDKISMSSVTLADFESGPVDLLEQKQKKGRRRSKRKQRGSRCAANDALPVAEFHNEAFDFAESTTAVERVNDVEL